MSSELPYYRKLLHREFELRRRKNSRYSIRAFARHLDFDPTALSQLMAGKRFISVDRANELFRELPWSVKERSQFLISLGREREARGLKRKNRRFRTLLASPAKAVGAAHDLSSDFFEAISEWHHYAILEMTELDDFRADPDWIARELRIHPREAAAALNRLIELGMLVEKAGRYKKAHSRFATAGKSKTAAGLRRRQKQILLKSLESLTSDPIAIRNHSSITFAIDPTRIEEARLKIESFFWEMSEFLGSKNQSQVYEMSVNLFPLQKGKSP